MHDEAKMKELRKKYLKEGTGGYDIFKKYGTAGFTHDSILSGDGPVKNWGGAGTVDFPSETSRKISDDAVIEMKVTSLTAAGIVRSPAAVKWRKKVANSPSS